MALGCLGSSVWTLVGGRTLGCNQQRGAASLCRSIHSFNKMVYCDGADGSVRIATVDKVTCLAAVPAGEPGRRAASARASECLRKLRLCQVATVPDHCQVAPWPKCYQVASSQPSALRCPPCTVRLPHPAGDKDGVLRWFEAYADALSSGRFAVEVSPALLERQ